MDGRNLSDTPCSGGSPSHWTRNTFYFRDSTLGDLSTPVPYSTVLGEDWKPEATAYTLQEQSAVPCRMGKQLPGGGTSARMVLVVKEVGRCGQFLWKHPEGTDGSGSLWAQRRASGCLERVVDLQCVSSLLCSFLCVHVTFSKHRERIRVSRKLTH